MEARLCDRCKKLEDGLLEVRRAIIENAQDVLWLDDIETVVDRIDHILDLTEPLPLG